MNHSVLIVDDDNTIRSSLSHLFKSKGCDVYEAGTAAEGTRLAEEAQPDLAILDHRLPDKTGIEALAGMKAAQPDMMVIMLTGYGSIPGAVDAIRAGAFDYLVKPVDIGSLEIASDRAFEVHGLMKENQALKARDKTGLAEETVGSSPEVHKLQLMINLLAENPNTTVLIEGESGTGKELAARSIHGLSVRGEKPFMDINCAALSENLLESELFGHEKGAFTDAKGVKKGLLEVADGGTVFLDEIGELSQSLQPKLLRVLETRTFRRVGGTKDIKVDVRVIAATNRSLQDSVRERSFREDLYYRLRVMPLTIPPLRDRGGDVMVLARHFISVMNRGLKKDIKGVSPECEIHLLSYRWPGNIRELKNVVERAVILSPGPLITPEHLPWELTGACIQDTPERVEAFDLELTEKRHIQKVLAHTSGNRSSAARLLGISRSTLLIKLKKYGMV